MVRSQTVKDMALQAAHNAAGASSMVASAAAVSSGAVVAANAGIGKVAKTMSLASTKLAIGASFVTVSVGVGIALAGISDSTVIAFPALPELQEEPLSPEPTQFSDSTTQGSFLSPVPSPTYPSTAFRCGNNAVAEKINHWVTIADFSEEFIDLVPLGTLFESAYNAVSRECREKFKRHIPQEGAKLKNIRAIEGTVDFEAEFEVTVVCSPACPAQDKLFGSTIRGPNFRRRMQEVSDQAVIQVNEVAFDIYFNRLVDIWSLKVDPTGGDSSIPKEPSPGPSRFPSVTPSSSPSSEPSLLPSSNPSTSLPTFEPSSSPTGSIVSNQTAEPMPSPTKLISDEPSLKSPTDAQTGSVTALPTSEPTSTGVALSSDEPSSVPTRAPTTTPFISPVGSPTDAPTGNASQPLSGPSDSPSASLPSSVTSVVPTPPQISAAPSVGLITTVPSDFPSDMPSSLASSMPSALPTTPTNELPSASPSTTLPSARPSTPPSILGSALPTILPSSTPSTTIPSMVPSALPSPRPSTSTPSMMPSSTPSTQSPTTLTPTQSPTTLTPTQSPTTLAPTQSPTTLTPTQSPTTLAPTQSPTTGTPANCLSSPSGLYVSGTNQIAFDIFNPNAIPRIFDELEISGPVNPADLLSVDFGSGNVLPATDDGAVGGSERIYNDVNVPGGDNNLAAGGTVTVTITFSATFSGGVYTVGMECQGGGNVCNDNCLDVSFTL